MSHFLSVCLSVLSRLAGATCRRCRMLKDTTEWYAKSWWRRPLKLECSRSARYTATSSHGLQPRYGCHGLHSINCQDLIVDSMEITTPPRGPDHSHLTRNKPICLVVVVVGGGGGGEAARETIMHVASRISFSLRRGHWRCWDSSRT